MIRSAHTDGESRSIPVDVEQVKVTKAGMHLNEDGQFVKKEIGEMAYISHFATCKYADEFRKKRYSKVKNEKKMTAILLNDLAGMMRILSNAHSLVKLQKVWMSPEYQNAILKLNEFDKNKLTEHKDLLKRKYAEHQLSILT